MNLNDRQEIATPNCDNYEILSKDEKGDIMEEQCGQNTKSTVNENSVRSENGCEYLQDDIYIEKLIENEEEKQDIQHVESLLDGSDVNRKQNDNQIKNTLEYLKSMKEVAKLNNLSLEDFSKILFNSKSVEVQSASPRSSLRKKLAASRNTRKTKFANEALEKKRSKNTNKTSSITDPVN